MLNKDFPAVVTRDEWLAARKELLVKEKELTRAHDRVNAERRELPMVRIDKDYVLEGENGKVGLLDLFEGRQQLVLHHFMWNFDLDDNGDEHPKDVGCTSCSSTADQIGDLVQLNVRGITLAAVSRGPFAKLDAFKKRMGWIFPWYSSAGSDFNYDFHVTVDDRVGPVLMNFRDETEIDWQPRMRGDYPAISTFVRDGDEVFHTYQTFARGIEYAGNATYYLDLTPFGRVGPGAGSAEMRFHDEYGPEDGA
ncbi:DUF899 domain-containing protein [Tenggerimyces flavus]|uniref:DUF899 domain-containing protein n=1 Tax=Tenggerimyces flavus TaxID=1708749 RepID=A0ABV7YM84_9ACTN|nr:DUF899 domain-containing protein [Tenggerimyces flavus]MBM7787318.1 putative dithiol-disulfide oxidoreductase (DUF899 family) [Tenggerimyces flavus]